MENTFTNNYQELYTKVTSKLKDKYTVKTRIHRIYYDKLQRSYDMNECFYNKEDIIKEYIEFLVSSSLTIGSFEDFDELKKDLIEHSNELISPYYYDYLLEVAKSRGYNFLLGLIEVNIIRLEAGADSIALVYQILYLLLCLLMLLKNIK